MTEYTVLPRECQTGTCGHDPGQCILYRSRRCLSGECQHAADNLVCGTSSIAAAVAQPPASARQEDQDQGDDFPPCGKCDGSPADHIGWARGHLFIRRMTHQTTPPAEVQPHGAGATAAPEASPVDVTRPYCYAAYRLDQTPPRRLSWGQWKTAPSPMTEAAHAARYEVMRIRTEHAYLGPLRVHIWQTRDEEHYRQEPPTDAYTVTLTGRAPTPPETIQDDPEPVTVRCRAGHLWDEECPDCP